MSRLSCEPICLWSELPLVVPDREQIQDQRVCSVDNPTITPFWPEGEAVNRPAVLIFPGGGYTRLSITHEGTDIARWFSERGVVAFVVKYRLREYGFPASLLDGLRAVRLLRKNAQDWGIDPNKIGVLGFSAGGHVAASIAVRSSFSTLVDDPLGEVDASPNFTILGYPLITLDGENTHKRSKVALLGSDPDEQLVYENSLQFHVGSGVSPMFIFHGVDDHAVPVINSLAFFAEVQKFNKQSEMHIYQSSVHGVGMIQGQGSISSWPNALTLWLRQNQFMPTGEIT